MFFQDHDGNVSEYKGGFETWNCKFNFSSNPSKNWLLLISSSAWEIILTKDNVLINTPLTATNSATADKPYVFYVSKSSPAKVTVYNDGKSSEVAVFVPGTKLGAVTLRGKVYLIQKPLEHPASVWTRVYDGGAWELGGQVIS